MKHAAATKAELRREILELRNVGERMANMCFNWSQGERDTTFSENDRDCMRRLYKEWDAVKRAERVEER